MKKGIEVTSINQLGKERDKMEESEWDGISQQRKREIVFVPVKNLCLI